MRHVCHACDICISFTGHMDVTLVTYTLYVIHVSLVMLKSNFYVCLSVKFCTCTIVCFLQDTSRVVSHFVCGRVYWTGSRSFA